jgi:hypothetical protein
MRTAVFWFSERQHETFLDGIGGLGVGDVSDQILRKMA